MIFLASLKGSAKFPSMIGVKYCGTAYWSLNIFMFIICAVYIKVLIDRFTTLDDLKDRLGYKFHETEYRITPESSMQISFYSIVAGTLAGMLGIGGGMVINPLLLELEMKPTVVASTTGFTILFTSSLSLAQTILHGDIFFDQIVWFGILSFIGSYGVSWVINYFTRLYKRESIILYSISFVVFLALIVVPLYGVIRIQEDGVNLHFSHFC